MSKKKQPELVAFATALHSAINAIPEAERAYVVNFVGKNAHRPAKEMLDRLVADLAGRAEAAAIQRHRDEKVLADALDAAKRLGVEVAITGVAAEPATESVQGKGN